ncbi:MAG TPA: hypothetical protein VJR89_25790, partial [Polyangiales bacterium]|nr:hypothetical protein [Polyangiales bacterium]
MRCSLLMLLSLSAACEPAWLETPAAERARLAGEGSAKLEQTLRALPGVQRAQVLYTPAAGLAALPETLTPASATLL